MDNEVLQELLLTIQNSINSADENIRLGYTTSARYDLQYAGGIMDSILLIVKSEIEG